LQCAGQYTSGMDCCPDLLILHEVVSLLLTYTVLDVYVCQIDTHTHTHTHIYVWLLRRYATVGRTGTFPDDGAMDE